MYRLIIADDERIEREGIRLFLERSGLPVEIREAKNGRVALELIQQGPCDLLITDIKMPIMDGLQLVKEAREITPELMVIILSGVGEFEYARTAIQLRVIHYLLKPIEEEEFKGVLSAAMVELEARRKDKGNGSASSRESDAPESDPEHHGRAVNEVLRIISAEFSKDLSLEYLASRVHLTPSYVSFVFKKETGVSVVKYINRFRMEKAKEFLDQSNYKIVDVYRMVGFSDPSYFGMTFKNYYGLTPSQYRESAGHSK